MKRWQRFAALASAAALAVGLTACGGGGSQEPEESDEPKVLKMAISAALTSLDPARSATPGVVFLTPVYEALIYRDFDGLLQPGLATEWELSDDAKQLELTLREGVEFQDGTPFDAEAVKANLDAAPDRGGQVTSQLSVITETEIVDDTHVVLTLSRPAADILGVLASEAGMMISPEALGAEDLGENPVGTGPFVVDTQNQNGITYNAWDGYWDKDRIKLDRIEIQTGLTDDATRLNAVLTGEIQAANARYTDIAEAEARAPDTVVPLTGNQATVIAISLNAAQGVWADEKARLAAHHAINREGISDALFDGGGCEPVAQPYPTSYWANDPSLEDTDLAAYDPDLSRELLEEAGLVGTPVKLYVGSTTLYQNIAAAVQEQLNAVGFSVTVESFDTTTLADIRAKGEYEASVSLMNSGRPDPAQFLKQYYSVDGVFNFGKVSYDGLDDLLDEMNATADQDARAESAHEIMELVLEQGPIVVPICSPASVWLHSSEIEGIQVAVNFDNNITGVSFVE